MSTLAATARALDAVHSRFGFDLVPEGPDWHPYPTLPVRLGEWAAELTGEGRAPSEVAMSLLSGVTGPVLRPLAVAWVLRAELLAVDAATTAVRRRGRVTDRAALACAVRPADPAELAERLAAMGTPIIDTLHRVTRYGRRNLWGGLGDVLSSHALWAGRHRGDPPVVLRARFAEVQAVLDRVSAEVGAAFPRAEPFPLVGPERETVAQVRGTCCLHYRIPGRTHADGTPRYCGSCPLIDDEDRRVRMRPLVDEATTTARTAHLGSPVAPPR